MLKISIATGPFLPCGSGPAGAVEKLWFGVAKQFVTLGHQVTIIARAWPGQPADETVGGVRIVRRSGYKRSTSVKWDLLNDLAYSLRLLVVLPNADITVVNAFWLPVFATGFKHRLGKVVLNVARFPKHQMSLYRSVDRLSAVSQAIADEIVRQTPSVQGLVRVVPNPVDVEWFLPADPLPPRNGGFRILFTGRVHPEKGLHLLIRAIRYLVGAYPDVELAIVGPTLTEHGGGGATYMAELKRLAQRLPVRFESAIGDSETLARRMVDADYYCYPSLADRGESFGVAPLEAMALGYVPILSNLPCFREFAMDGVNCFVFDHHHADPVEQLAGALRRAMEAPELTRAMGQNAVQVAQRFSYRNVAQAYLNDWQSLVNQTTDKGPLDGRQ